jgi:hypothetical protein
VSAANTAAGKAPPVTIGLAFDEQILEVLIFTDIYGYMYTYIDVYIHLYVYMYILYVKS